LSVFTLGVIYCNQTFAAKEEDQKELEGTDEKDNEITNLKAEVNLKLGDLLSELAVMIFDYSSDKNGFFRIKDVYALMRSSKKTGILLQKILKI
jgi:hypothetical protein